jgi:predicted TPR repeat methyltransferase
MEMGCGLGLLRAEIYSSLPGVEYAGCDISHSAVQHVADKNVIQIDLNRDRLRKFGRSFDCVIGSGVFEYVEDISALLGQIAEMLDGKGQYLVFSYFNVRHIFRRLLPLLGRTPYRHPEWRHIHTYVELRSILNDRRFLVLSEIPVSVGLGPSPPARELGGKRAPRKSSVTPGLEDLLAHQKIFVCRKLDVGN